MYIGPRYRPERFKAPPTKITCLNKKKRHSHKAILSHRGKANAGGCCFSSSISMPERVCSAHEQGLLASRSVYTER